jgi:hypothetical protein
LLLLFSSILRKQRLNRMNLLFGPFVPAGIDYFTSSVGKKCSHHSSMRHYDAFLRPVSWVFLPRYSQPRKPAHVANQIHHSNLDLGSRLANRACQLIGLPGKYTFNPRSHL